MANPKHMMAVLKAGESNDSPASLNASDKGTEKKKRARVWLIMSIIVLVAGVA